MRDYGVKGQIGLEATPQEYIRKLVTVFMELRRVLKDDGSFYLNIGDTYCGSWGSESKKEPASVSVPGHKNFRKQPAKSPQARVRKDRWLQPKQLLGIPERVMIKLQENGWILRNKIIWHKPNHMPSSAKDRLTNSWEYIFHFVKSKKYYYDLDSIREPHKSGTSRAERDLKRMRKGRTEFDGKRRASGYQKSFIAGHPAGRNPGDCWDIKTKAFPDAHFAVYPEDLCIRPILSSCPPRGIVLDMFAGAGTTCLVANKLGRRFIGIEINPEYVEMAGMRLQSRI